MVKMANFLLYTFDNLKINNVICQKSLICTLYFEVDHDPPICASCWNDRHGSPLSALVEMQSHKTFSQAGLEL
jgi:hypothetical protein